MAELRLGRVSKSYGDSVKAVDDVSLCFPSGKITALLGPSGCGKTTLLRIIAGLEEQSEGVVLLSGRDISKLTASNRRFGMVFQSFALFPHLNVEQNVAYSLAISGVPMDERLRRAKELLDLVKLPDYAKRRIGELSGGQRQRVAIARALAQNPTVFLLDEPMSALDAQLREQMQVELRLLQQQLGITTIVVTHDQREAMTMADQVVIMADGRIEQVGSPQQVYQTPASHFVASFIGQNNFLDGVVCDGRIEIGDRFIHLDQPLRYLPGANVHVSCRPEFSRVHRTVSRPDRGINLLPATVTLVREVGPVREVFLDVNGSRFLCVESGKTDVTHLPGDKVVAELPGHALMVFPRAQAS